MCVGLFAPPPGSDTAVSCLLMNILMCLQLGSGTGGGGGGGNGGEEGRLAKIVAGRGRKGGRCTK